MPGASAGAGGAAVSWLCTWWRQVAGAGAVCRCWCWCCELAVHRLLVPVLLRAGAGCRVPVLVPVLVLVVLL